MPVCASVGIVGIHFRLYGGLLRFPVLCGRRLFVGDVLLGIGHRVAYYLAVLEIYDAGAVFLGKLPVVGDHYDETVARNFFEQLHNAHARFAVECARGLVGEDYLGIVDDCAGDCDALHLSARKLIGFLLRLFLESHPSQRFEGTFSALLFSHARQGKAERDVLENADMRD